MRITLLRLSVACRSIEAFVPDLEDSAEGFCCKLSISRFLMISEHS